MALSYVRYADVVVARRLRVQHHIVGGRLDRYPDAPVRAVRDYQHVHIVIVVGNGQRRHRAPYPGRRYPSVGDAALPTTAQSLEIEFKIASLRADHVSGYQSRASTNGRRCSLIKHRRRLPARRRFRCRLRRRSRIPRRLICVMGCTFVSVNFGLRRRRRIPRRLVFGSSSSIWPVAILMT